MPSVIFVWEPAGCDGNSGQAGPDSKAGLRTGSGQAHLPAHHPVPELQPEQDWQGIK